MSDLAQIDERNVGLYQVDPEEDIAHAIEVEDVQADFLRAESTIGANVRGNRSAPAPILVGEFLYHPGRGRAVVDDYPVP
jgi:hypothetical protein